MQGLAQVNQLAFSLEGILYARNLIFRSRDSVHYSTYIDGITWKMFAQLFRKWFVNARTYQMPYKDQMIYIYPDLRTNS